MRIPISLPLLLSLALCGPMQAQDSPYAYHSLSLPGGGELEYALVLPGDYDSEKYYPVLLALPPGQQDRGMVEASMRRYWGSQARERNWIVVSPIAPDGQLFFKGGEEHLPDLLRHMRIKFKVEGNRIHLAGSSNGGRSAFRLATRFPHEFRSLVVLPGFPPEDSDRALLPNLEGISIRMFAGEDDERWVRAMRETLATLQSLQMNVAAQAFPGEGHVPASLDGDVIMELLAEIQGEAPASSPLVDAALILDDFHDAASKADEERYFGHFSPEAIFFGTAPEERWNVEEFRQYAKSAFQRDSAWIYVPQERAIELAPGENVAWFDEVLVNAKYGVCRGTGVLRKISGTWKVAQYNLSVPVPNDILPGVVETIRQSKRY